MSDVRRSTEGVDRPRSLPHSTLSVDHYRWSSDAAPPSASHASTELTAMPEPTSLTKAVLNKVPQVTIWFWIVKVMATTVGETGADLLTTNLHLGLTVTRRS